MDYCEFGTFGGFTGGKNFRKLYSNGLLVNSSKITASSSENETFIKNVSMEFVTKLQQLFSPVVLNQNIDNPSNMSYMVKYKLGNDIYHWIYPQGEVPEFLKIIVGELNIL